MAHNTTYSMSILSGKGGVGKSSLALNLGYALQKTGNTVLLMDCDFGLANIDILVGAAPHYFLHDTVWKKIDIHDVAYPVLSHTKGRYDFLPANSGTTSFIELDTKTQKALVKSVNQFASTYDFLVLDIGAGVAPTSLRFGAMAHEHLVVVTPEPTSLTDGYALIKMLTLEHNITNFKLIINQVATEAEADLLFSRLSKVCKSFLGVELELLGWIRFDAAFTESIRQQKILSHILPHCLPAIDIADIANKITALRQEDLPSINTEYPLQMSLNKFPK